MSLREQQDFMARLFTDEGLRRKFLADPDSVGLENGLNSTETDELKSVVPAELDLFADSLFWKRRNAVEKLLPLTRKELGNLFESNFRRFASDFVPITIKKHLEDASGFCRFLTHEDVGESIREIARYEQAKIQFYFYGKSFVFRRLLIDVPACDGAMSATENFDFKRKTKYCLWFNIFNTRRRWIW